MYRGDYVSAWLIAREPAHQFAEFDRMLEAAFAFGVAMKGRE